MDKYLIRTIIVIMTSIGQVEYRMHDQFTGIYREGILFAKIYAEGVYLIKKSPPQAAGYFRRKLTGDSHAASYIPYLDFSRIFLSYSHFHAYLLYS